MLGNKTRKEEQIAPVFKYTSFVEMEIYIHSGKSSAEVMGFWLDTVSDTLDLLHNMENVSVCLLLTDRGDMRIYNRYHFPKMFRSWVKFCKFPYPDIMKKPTVVDRGRRVDCTVQMGFREDPATFLDEAKVNISQIEALQLSIKGIQE